jgi:hypothetical protein
VKQKQSLERAHGRKEAFRDFFYWFACTPGLRRVPEKGVLPSLCGRRRKTRKRRRKSHQSLSSCRTCTRRLHVFARLTLSWRQTHFYLQPPASATSRDEVEERRKGVVRSREGHLFRPDSSRLSFTTSHYHYPPADFYTPYAPHSFPDTLSRALNASFSPSPTRPPHQFAAFGCRLLHPSPSSLSLELPVRTSSLRAKCGRRTKQS